MSEEADAQAGPEAAVPAAAEAVAAQLNDAEARNLAFLVSHHLSRNEEWRLSAGPEQDAKEVTELAARVAQRLSDLSLRLGSDEARAQLATVS